MMCKVHSLPYSLYSINFAYTYRKAFKLHEKGEKIKKIETTNNVLRQFFKMRNTFILLNPVQGERKRVK